MKKIFLAVVLLAVLGSCSPTFYTYSIERMGPTSSGYETAGKSLCVITDSLHTDYAVDFTRALNEQYNNKVGLLTVTHMKEGATLKEIMLDFAMKTNRDIIIFVTDQIHIYDTQRYPDEVQSYHAVSPASVSAALLTPTWLSENYKIAVYESRSAWAAASDKMDEHDFQGAIDIWCSLLNTDSYVDKAALEMNIATALYLLGKPEMARKWFQLSTSTATLDGYSSLQRKLNL